MLNVFSDSEDSVWEQQYFHLQWTQALSQGDQSTAYHWGYQNPSSGDKVWQVVYTAWHRTAVQPTPSVVLLLAKFMCNRPKI